MGSGASTLTTHPCDDGAGGLNSVIFHCPFESECILDADCADDELRCRSELPQYERPVICDRCAEDCNVNTGECQDAAPPECDERPCSPPLICESGQCVPRCQSDADCSA